MRHVLVVQRSDAADNSAGLQATCYYTLATNWLIKPRASVRLPLMLCFRVDLRQCAQAHMGRVELPITDYVGDTKSALDNSVRVLQAITDVAADAGWLGTTLAAVRLIQGLMQVLPFFATWCQ